MGGRSAPRGQRSGWTIREMTFEQATAEDARRYLAMTPAEPVRLVPELPAAWLSAQGIREPPRLRRVYSYPEPAPGPSPWPHAPPITGCARPPRSARAPGTPGR